MTLLAVLAALLPNLGSLHQWAKLELAQGPSLCVGTGLRGSNVQFTLTSITAILASSELARNHARQRGLAPVRLDRGDGPR